MANTHLLSGQFTANGDSAEIDLESVTRDSEGYRTVYAKSAVFGASVVTAYISPDGTNWFAAGTITANGLLTFIHVGSHLKLTMSSYAASAVDYWIK